MRVLICPDKFAGTLTAVEAAEAIARGWRQAVPADGQDLRPLADGGPGFLDVLRTSLVATRVPVPTADPLGRPVPGEVLVVDGTAYLESAQACGLHLLAPEERDPKVTTSYGLGILVAAAVEYGVREVVIGLGGSGTNDCGAGMLAALGAQPLDAAGYALPYGGAALLACTGLGGQPRLRGVRLVAATDVDSPLTGALGASAVFGPQKGATPEEIELLDAALGTFAGVLQRALPECPDRLAEQPGAGAAGGLGAALLAAGGRVVSGLALVRQVTGLDAALDGADLVITGEGSFDEQSLRGKVVSGVAEGARRRGKPCLVFAGRSSTAAEAAAAAGVTATYTLVEHFGDVRTAMARAGDGLAELAAEVARDWPRG
ncbi:MAG: glycerate kinase [Micromonosporaceae bacterium]|nr:glycerate kinase [Micromonosporaceae bacterium]